MCAGHLAFAHRVFQGAHAGLGSGALADDEERLHLVSPVGVRADNGEALLHLALDFLFDFALVSLEEVLELGCGVGSVHVRLGEHAAAEGRAGLLSVCDAGVVGSDLLAVVLRLYGGSDSGNLASVVAELFELLVVAHQGSVEGAGGAEELPSLLLILFELLFFLFFVLSHHKQ